MRETASQACDVFINNVECADDGVAYQVSFNVFGHYDAVLGRVQTADGEHMDQSETQNGSVGYYPGPGPGADTQVDINRFSFTVYSGGTHDITVYALDDDGAPACALSQCNNEEGEWATDTAQITCPVKEYVCSRVIPGVCADDGMECCCISEPGTPRLCTTDQCCLTAVSVSCDGGGVCCAGDRIIVNATYEGDCPPTLFIQVDMENPDGTCTLCDDSPQGVEGCNDQCSIDGVSAPSFCSRGKCIGYYTLPRGVYSVPVQECTGKTTSPTAAAAYTGQPPCDGGTWFTTIPRLSGSLRFGTNQECLQQCAGR
jgi:hypothetical protein